MRNKGLLTLIALLVIASMVLVGCGGGWPSRRRRQRRRQPKCRHPWWKSRLQLRL